MPNKQSYQLKVLFNRVFLKSVLAIKATVFPLFVCLFTSFDTEFTQPTLNLEKTIIKLNLGLGIWGRYWKVPKGTKRVPKGTEGVPSSTEGERRCKKRYREVPRGTKWYREEWPGYKLTFSLLMVLCDSLWFFVVLGGCWLFTVVLGGFWWFLVVLGGSWLFLVGQIGKLWFFVVHWGF